MNDNEVDDIGVTAEQQDEVVVVDKQHVLLQCKYCRKSVGTLLKCSVGACHKSAHLDCFNSMKENFIASSKIKDLTIFNFEENTVVCGKRCFTSFCKTKLRMMIATVESKKGWLTDAITRDGACSTSILIDWLTTHGNYARWTGEDKKSGTTKDTLAGVINDIIIQQINVDRGIDAVKAKIASLEKQYKEAAWWKSHTGQGVESGCIKAAMKKRCLYYYELEPVMDDHRTMNPLAVYGSAIDTQRDSDNEANNPSEAKHNHFDFVNDERRTPVESPSESDVDSINNQVETAKTKKTPLKKKRINHLKSSLTKKMKGSEADDEDLKLSLLKKEQMINESKYQQQNFELKQSELDIKKEEIRLKATELQSKGPQTDADLELTRAKVEKLQEDTFISREKAKQAVIETKCMILRERKKLKDEGIPHEEIDIIMPLF